MRALVYNSALNVYGGGERYTFALADVLSEKYDVLIGAKWLPDRAELERRGFPAAYDMREIPGERFSRATRGFDLVVGNRMSPALHPSFADRSAVVVQFPAKELASLRRPRALLKQRRAMGSFDTFITYSQFCAEFVQRRWNERCEVINPPAELGRHLEPKTPGILAIGRFEPSKQHHALIDAYTALPASVRTACPLHLVGGAGVDVSSQVYLAELQRVAAHQNVVFHANASQQELVELLESTTLFWHAKGYARPPDRPDLAEHFGIVAVEAMSHGLVPMVVDDGGLPEIVDAECGILWKSVAELTTATGRLLGDDSERSRLARRAADRSRAFSREAFADRVRAILF